MHFETQDNPKYVPIQLFMGDIKLGQNGVGSIWAFLDARSDGHSESDITLHLHSHFLRGKSNNVRARMVVPVVTKDWALRNKTKEYFDLNEIVHRYGARWGQVIFAILAYAFLLAAEGRHKIYADHTISVYLSFLTRLDR
ncbi:hypothetical protein BDU57DRAFT_279429 [Ampelomyces quisqualis]|uniref:Uncharacterized protein n=1 Tax=Ampelomyces quisqualis TaxID=50730 RepID=A0A6A5QJL8_AMPQU|nr:hypothetical protein BDU57DRAFT_279429 [Ampelomyces quisqualis]